MSTFQTIESGNQFLAIPENEEMTKFAAVTNLDALKNAGLKNPYHVATVAGKAKVKEEELERLNLGVNRKEAIKAHLLRGSVQRSFTKARINNGAMYKVYLKRCHDKLIEGDAPPINIWVPSVTGEVTYNGDEGRLILPYNGTLVAIDGETQTYARYLLAEDMPESYKWPFIVVFHCGISPEAAQQRLHDYNRYGKRVSEMETTGFNVSGALTKNAATALSAIVERDEIERSSRMPSANKNRTEKISVLQAQYGIIGLNMGRESSVVSPSAWIAKLNDPASDGHINGDGAGYMRAVIPQRQRFHKVPPEVFMVLGAAYHEKREAGVVGRVDEAINLWQQVGRTVPRLSHLKKIKSCIEAFCK